MHSISINTSLQTKSIFLLILTYRLLKEASPDPETTLTSQEADFQQMVQAKYKHYTSSDPLDLGEALWLTHWALPGAPWAQAVASHSVNALEELWQEGYFSPTEEWGRLAFREFGTTLGVQVNPLARKERWVSRVESLHAFWTPRVFHRDRDISPVMLVSSLVPGCWQKGYSKLEKAPQRVMGSEASHSQPEG